MQLFTLGGALVGIVVGLILAIYAAKKSQPKLAQAGFFCCVITGSIGGLILAVPAAAVFCWLIGKAASTSK
jgi:hypothetical protein